MAPNPFRTIVRCGLRRPKLPQKFNWDWVRTTT